MKAVPIRLKTRIFEKRLSLTGRTRCGISGNTLTLARMRMFFIAAST